MSRTAINRQLTGRNGSERERDRERERKMCRLVITECGPRLGRVRNRYVMKNQ